MVGDKSTGDIPVAVHTWTDAHTERLLITSPPPTM